MTLISVSADGPGAAHHRARCLGATALAGGALALWLAMTPMLATSALAADGDGGASGGANPVGAGATGFVGNPGGTGTDAGAVAGGGGGTGGGGGGAGGGTGGNGGNAFNPLTGIGQGGAAGQPGTIGSLSNAPTASGGGQGGGGGGGGGGLNGSTSTSIINTTPLAGGDGGAGGRGGTVATTFVNINNIGGGGGGGGAGGYGAVVTGSAADSNTSSIAGGNGGAGGDAQVGPAFGGTGGAGGTAAAFTASGVTLTNGGTVQGGNGGNGGVGGGSFFVGGNGGNGGTGGSGLAFLGAGAALTNNSLIQGGNGGNGGNLGAAQFAGANGNGGTGGTGVAFQASGGALTNNATIRGGNGGASATPASVGLGGIGVSGIGLTITNSGAIAGGLAGDGVTRANAISFTGGVNSLMLLPGSSISGNVAAFSAADTLTLGGSGNGGALNAAQYQGFGIFNKTGTSTWTLLTGASSPTSPWVISGGVLTAGNTTNVFGATSLITVNAPGTLDLGGFSQTIGSLTGSGTVTNSGATFPATLTAGGDNSSTIFSGTIQNGNSTLSLTKEGIGVFTLSGTNTYTGATTINAGTLALTGNGSIAPSSVNVANAGSIFDISGTTSGAGIASLSGVAGGSVNLGGKTLTLSNASGTFDGAIGGAGGGLALTAGSETLTGSNSYTGPTTINGGTLLVNGSIAPSAAFVNSGGTLAGTGTVGNVTVHAGGILAPGPTGAPGSLAISGNLAFASGAIYLVNVTSANASAANVSGVATLTGGSVRTAFSAGTQMGTSYTILTSSGLVGTFSGVTGNVPAGFIETLSYVGNNVVLNVTTQLGGTGAPPNGGQGGGNQQNVTNTLVNYFNNGGMLPPAIVAMFGLTGNNLSFASSQLSGEAATGAQSSAFQLMTGFLGLLTDPFVEGRGGGGNAIGFAAEDATLPPEIASAYAAVFKAPPRQAQPFEQRWNVWGSAFGGANHTDGNRVVGSHDLTASAGGFAAGAEYRVTPFTTVGFALAGAGTGWSLAQGLGSGQSDALMAGIYGRTSFGPAYVAASLAFANHWMSTDRISLASDQLTAKFNAQSYGGRVEAGYRFASPLLAVTPYAAVNAQAFVAPSYSEQDVSGGGLGLTFAGHTATDIRGEAGARFDRLTAIDPTTLLVLRGKLGYAHDWVSDPSLAAIFQALPGTNFIVNGAAPAHDSGLVAAGAELRFASGISLAAKFDGEFAAHSQTYAGTGTMRYSW